MDKSVVISFYAVSAFQYILFLLLGISIVMIFVASCRKKPSTAGYKLLKAPIIIYLIEASVVLVGLCIFYVAFIRSYIDVVNFFEDYLDNTYVGTADKFAEYFGHDLQKELLKLFVWDKDSTMQNMTMPVVISMFAQADCKVSLCWFEIILYGIICFGYNILTIIYFAKLIKSVNVITYIIKNPTAPVRRNVSMYAVIYTFIFAVVVVSFKNALFAMIAVVSGKDMFKLLFLFCCGFALARYHRKIRKIMTY